jgi:hypothetical protein
VLQTRAKDQELKANTNTIFQLLCYPIQQRTTRAFPATLELNKFEMRMHAFRGPGPAGELIQVAQSSIFLNFLFSGIRRRKV